MFFRTATLLLCSALSLTAIAQEPALAVGSGNVETALVEQLLALDDSPTSWAASDSNSLVPIWSGADGHLLALVAVPDQWTSPLLAGTTAQPGPASWYLLGGGALVEPSGLRWQTNGGFHLDALFGASQTALPTLCGVGCETNRQSALTTSLGLGWMSPEGALDLSYGLSWLQTRDASQNVVQGVPNLAGGVPVLTLPEALSYGLQSETSLFARGRWRFDQDTALDIGASYGRGNTLAAGTLGNALPGIDIDQLSLSLGLDSGSLRGAIVGHVLRSDDPLLIGKKWTALDLGVSWRTPWRGEISVGAQNLWSAPLDAPRDADPSQARTPYIQYRQDL
jgi:hypothetical protein